MCLSNVYVSRGERRELLCKNVQSVTRKEDDNTMIFTDIMGVQYQSAGEISGIDLVNNIIDIREGD